MYEKLVVAIDRSARAPRVLMAAKSFAAASGAQVRIVHVLESSAGIVGSFEVDAEARARQLVEGAMADMEAAGVPAEGAVLTVMAGRAAAEILAQAEEVGASLIVIGTRQHSDLARLVSGSVSQQVIHRSTCPVLVVP